MRPCGSIWWSYCEILQSVWVNFEIKEVWSGVLEFVQWIPSSCGNCLILWESHWHPLVQPLTKYRLHTELDSSRERMSLSTQNQLFQSSFLKRCCDQLLFVNSFKDNMIVFPRETFGNLLFRDGSKFIGYPGRDYRQGGEDFFFRKK